MWAIILIIVLLFVLPSIFKGLWKLIKGAAIFLGAIFVIALVVYLLREYGEFLLKAALILCAACSLLAIAAYVINKIQLNVENKRCIKWINDVGIARCSQAPGREETLKKMVVDGIAVFVGDNHIASAKFCETLEKSIHPYALITPIAVETIARPLSSSFSRDSIPDIISYLQKKNKVIYFTSSTSSRAGGISQTLFNNMKAVVDKNSLQEGIYYQKVFSTQEDMMLLKEDLSWLIPLFLDYLTEKGYVIRISGDGKESGQFLYKSTAPTALSTATYEEFLWDEL